MNYSTHASYLCPPLPRLIEGQFYLLQQWMWRVGVRGSGLDSSVSPLFGTASLGLLLVELQILELGKSLDSPLVVLCQWT